MIMEVEELKEAKEAEEVSKFQAEEREWRRFDGFDTSASHAMSDASFSSCDQGAPSGRPRLAIRRVRALGVRCRTRDASFKSSRSRAVLLKRSQRAQAWSSA